MAIIQRDDELSRLPQTLLQMMVQKEQVNLQKEQQKIAQGQFKLQQQEMEARLAQQDAEGKAGEAIMRALAENPLFAGMIPQGLSGQAAAIAAPQLLEVARTQAGVEGQRAETALAAQRLAQEGDIFTLRKRELEAGIAASEAQTASERQRLTLDRDMFNFNRVATLQGMAAQELQNFTSLAANFGDPKMASRILFGSDTPPSPQQLMDLRMQEMDGVESREELVSSRLTRAAGIFNLPDQSVNQLREAFTEAGNDPQSVVNSIREQGLDEDTEAILFGVVRSVFPEAQIQVPPEKVGRWSRFLRGMLSGSTTQGRGEGVRARPSGG
jgi:hypothetical protein